jgi:hypothetical protein
MSTHPPGFGDGNSTPLQNRLAGDEPSAEASDPGRTGAYHAVRYGNGALKK